MKRDPSRKFVHQDLGGGPTRAAYALGCRCPGCSEANRIYLREWRVGGTKRSPLVHRHRGRPSANAVDRWKCQHPRCLALAGLVLDTNGRVYDSVGTFIGQWGEELDLTAIVA